MQKEKGIRRRFNYLFGKVQIEDHFGDGMENDTIEEANQARDVVPVVGTGGHACNQIERPAQSIQEQQQAPNVPHWTFNASDLPTKEQGYTSNA